MSDYVQDFQYVLDSIAQSEPAALWKRRFLEGLAFLPHPSGRGTMMCDSSVHVRLREVADKAITRGKYAGRLSNDAVFKELQLLFVSRFLKEGQELNERAADKTVSSAIRNAARNLPTLTHIIPCHLGHVELPTQFSIGPVHFQQRALTLAELKDAFQDCNENENGRRLSQDVIEYYNSFGWVAKTSIEDCDPTISSQRATQIVQGALDCLHLLLGSEYSNHMRIGGQRFYTDCRGSIAVGTTGKLTLTASVDWQSHPLGDDWWSSLNSEGGAELIGLMGVALKAANFLPQPAQLAQRFIDGAAWYGEATRDPFSASRIIKYVTAIERVVAVENHEGLSELIALRGAALLHQAGVDDLAALKERFKRIYNIRSRLAHGAWSPLDDSIYYNMKEAEFLARNSLLNALAAFRERISDCDTSSRHLDNAFKILIKWAESK